MRAHRWARFALAASLAATLVLATNPLAAQTAVPARVITAGGALTEIVFALGEQGRLVGVDTTSLFPAEARALPSVGYMRQLSAEGVLSLAPSLVLTTEDAGPPTALRQISSAGVQVRVFPAGHDLPAVRERIEGVATALGRPADGVRLADRVTEGLLAVRQAIARADRQPRVLFLMSAGQGAPQAAGRDTAAAAIITLAGGVNAIDGYSGYKPLSSEGAVAARPDVILLPSHAVAPIGGLDAVKRLPGVDATPAARAGRIVQMDSLALLGFGPRTALAARELATLLHPGLDLPDVPAPRIQ
jgi:iron complex transport system substrate-binding protein